MNDQSSLNLQTYHGDQCARRANKKTTAKNTTTKEIGSRVAQHMALTGRLMTALEPAGKLVALPCATTLKQIKQVL